jgi:hypothetical protein
MVHPLSSLIEKLTSGYLRWHELLVLSISKSSSNWISHRILSGIILPPIELEVLVKYRSRVEKESKIAQKNKNGRYVRRSGGMDDHMHGGFADIDGIIGAEI